MATQLQPIPRSQADQHGCVGPEVAHPYLGGDNTIAAPLILTAGDYQAVRSRPLPSDVEAGPGKSEFTPILPDECLGASM
jgi:hypothetical protein